MSVEGHVLNAPKIGMSNMEFEPNKGVWDIRDKGFFKAGVLSCWAVLNYSRYVRDDALK